MYNGYIAPGSSPASSYHLDERSAQYTRQEHQNPPNLPGYNSHIQAYLAQNPQHPAPWVTGVSSYAEPPYQSTYAPSGPPYLQGSQERHNVAQSRLGQFEPGVIDGIEFGTGNTFNKPGNCCEYGTIPPQLPGGRAGTLRTLNSQSRTYLDGRYQPQAFCQNCERLAKRLADEYPGLTILDVESGITYESACTQQALAMRERNEPAANIHIYLMTATVAVMKDRANKAPAKAHRKEQEARAAEQAADAAKAKAQRSGKKHHRDHMFVKQNAL
ncbi:hypothetical protein FB45DRAFT_1033455 [Roridomyces roridus]|uniref:Uncharacterized protein n=1 Tax=Roridomyces roridus TaxID=1738132 RepID=A0AAD7BFE9_9AGAR|nr:hypothetical protein FB45DRAFT_1033455 [Roridomyces roridus]